ncbi:hypothetical protein [Clostridium sp.]|uniref:hypothetical protein n=1 Tax=Clostridium sp. TaxID=1506 RepID=UPI0025BEBA91|nr:hypothetical protein [Clostridium sp.]
MFDKVYIVWKRSESEDTYGDTIIDIFKDKAKAQEVADDLRHKMMNDPNVDDDSTDYFVEGYSVN